MMPIIVSLGNSPGHARRHAPAHHSEERFGVHVRSNLQWRSHMRNCPSDCHYKYLHEERDRRVAHDGGGSGGGVAAAVVGRWVEHSWVLRKMQVGRCATCLTVTCLSDQSSVILPVKENREAALLRISRPRHCSEGDGYIY